MSRVGATLRIRLKGNDACDELAVRRSSIATLELRAQDNRR
jgi:hypothetical protein